MKPPQPANRPPQPILVVARNRRATHDYHIEETLDCGIALAGTEVKVLRASLASIEEAYARVDNGELWLMEMNVPLYGAGSWTNHEPKRTRKLLARKKEILKLETAVARKGGTLIPLRLFFNERGIAKITIGVAHGKKDYDKRQSIKERESKREISRLWRQN